MFVAFILSMQSFIMAVVQSFALRRKPVPHRAGSLAAVSIYSITDGVMLAKRSIRLCRYSIGK